MSKSLTAFEQAQLKMMQADLAHKTEILAALLNICDALGKATPSSDYSAEARKRVQDSMARNTFK